MDDLLVNGLVLALGLILGLLLRDIHAAYRVGRRVRRDRLDVSRAIARDRLRRLRRRDRP